MNEPGTSVDALFEAAARDDPDAVHLVFPAGGTSTYAETFHRSSRLAGALAAAGIGPGDRVALFLGNTRELYEAFIGCGMLGCIAVPLNTLNTAHENGKILADASPKAVISETARLTALPDGIFAGSPMCRIAAGGDAPGWTNYERALQSATPVNASRSRPGDAALIVYSSGTTGEPKGIVLSHHGLVLNSQRVGTLFARSSLDRFITLLPSFHLFGYSFDFLACALVRGRMVVMPAFEPATALDLIERHRVSLLAGVPLMFARMFDSSLTQGRDLSSLRLIDVGGGPVSHSLKRRLKSDLGIDTVESYGLTEISASAAVQVPGQDAADGASGPPLPGFSIRICDPDGNDLPTGTGGEILLSGPTMMIGYWNQPELTRRTVRDGWLHTGDLGMLDERGHVHVLDRIKDMIVSNGRNIYPKEVENVLSSHPAVQAVSVIGMPDELRGERVHACVVRNPAREVQVEELLEFCRQYLAPFKIPRAITFIEAMPTTASGKIRRFKLRELVRSVAE